MADDLSALEAQLLRDIDAAESLGELEVVRARALGKRSRLSAFMQELRQATPEERKQLGRQANQLKAALSGRLSAREHDLEEAELERRLRDEYIDASLDGRVDSVAALHAIRQTTDELVAIFAEMGFVSAEGPEIEDDFHNFSALNIPADHPARQMQDSFYINAEDAEGRAKLLRTHTSPVQIRTMMNQSPPVRVIAAGRTYRCDSDITHTPMFHQAEGLVVDKSTHFGHLKGCLHDFCRAFFEVSDVTLRFRPSYFPFTEPSAEVDIGCARRGGALELGGSADSLEDWLEILGCGMVHPNVLKHCGIDSETYQGFAFGVGIERLAMLKYGISDLRTFFEGDLRWLKHYGFSPYISPSLIRGLGL